MRTHYDSLKVTEDAPPEVIRAAYRALSLKYHPDRCGGGAQSQRMMQRLNEAYAVLSDARKRAGYDGDLKRARSPAASAPAGHPWPDLERPAPVEHEVFPSFHFRRRRPLWLKSALSFLSDARVVVPAVAVIWWIIFHLMARS